MRLIIILFISVVRTPGTIDCRGIKRTLGINNLKYIYEIYIDDTHYTDKPPFYRKKK